MLARIRTATELVPITLKGPVLALRHFHPPFLRKPSIDIDLAIRLQDLAAVCSALHSEGYRTEGDLSSAQAFGHDLTLLHESKPRIELHFRLTHGANGIPVDEFFSRARTYVLPDGTKTLILGEADELLHLVLHYAHHRFPLLFNLYEIRLLWNASSKVIKEEAIERAIQHGFFGAFLMTDVAFREIWNEPFLPEDRAYPKTWLHWRITPRLYWQCVNWSQKGPRQLSLGNRLLGRWLDLQITDTPSDALKLLRMYCSVAFARLKTKGWKTLRYRHFVSEE
jgi:hypothetical protein